MNGQDRTNRIRVIRKGELFEILFFQTLRKSDIILEYTPRQEDPEELGFHSARLSRSEAQHVANEILQRLKEDQG